MTFLPPAGPGSAMTGAQPAERTPAPVQDAFAAVLAAIGALTRQPAQASPTDTVSPADAPGEQATGASAAMPLIRASVPDEGDTAEAADGDMQAVTSMPGGTAGVGATPGVDPAVPAPDAQGAPPPRSKTAAALRPEAGRIDAIPADVPAGGEATPPVVEATPADAPAGRAEVISGDAPAGVDPSTEPQSDNAVTPEPVAAPTVATPEPVAAPTVAAPEPVAAPTVAADDPSPSGRPGGGGSAVAAGAPAEPAGGRTAADDAAPSDPVVAAAVEPRSSGTASGILQTGTTQDAEAPAHVARIADAVEALRDSAPPRQITLELEQLGGVRLAIRLRGDTVHVEVLPTPPGVALDPEWFRGLSAALQERGFSLGRDGAGQGGGDGPARQHDRPDVPIKPGRKAPTQRGWRL